MPRQMDWREFFEASQRQRDARERLIAELPADPRVKRLLHALDRLAAVDPTQRVLNDGTETLSIPIARLTQSLGVRSETTAKSYIDLAAQTPYLALSVETHRPHTYLVRWLAIVDGPSVAQPSAGEMHSAQTPAPRQARGAARGSTEPRLTPSTGPQLAPKRGSVGPQIGPQLTPSTGGQLGANSPSLKDPGVFESESKNPGSKTGLLRGTNSGPPQLADRRSGGTVCPCGCGRWFRQGFFSRWRSAIAARDLANPLDVDELYGFAVAEGVVVHSEQARFEVFVQAVRDRRRAKRPGAIFRENVIHTRWFGDQGEAETARRMILAADRAEAEAITATDQPAAADRQQQMEQLQRWQAQRAAVPVGNE